MYLSRREFVQYAAVTGLAAPLSAAGLAAEPLAAGKAPAPWTPPLPPFELEEITIQQLQDGLKSGKYTSRRLITAYLTRIQQIDATGPTLRSVIETNPDALALADAADAERK